MSDNYPDIDAPGQTKGHIFDHEDPVGTGDLVGEGVGGLAGGLTGMGVGMLGGPVGMVFGAIAGALGGWWGGRTIAASVTRLTEIEEAYYARRHGLIMPADSSYTYEEAEPAYIVGKAAAMNPDYVGRSFSDIEPDLRRGWAAADTPHDWAMVRPMVKESFEATRNPALYGLPRAMDMEHSAPTVERTVVVVEETL